MAERASTPSARSGRSPGELPVATLRLGGIYGPGQNGMVRLLRGTVHRVARRYVSNRIHVYDIAQAIGARARRADGLFNVWTTNGVAERNRPPQRSPRDRSTGNLLCRGQGFFAAGLGF